METAISADFPYDMKRVAVGDSEMAYVDEGQGRPIVFLHGNPTSSYLWRNVIPHVADLGRCLAPDLVAHGQSAPSPSGAYRYKDHIAYLDAWFEAVGLSVEGGKGMILVLHDWGAALGFDWARRHAAHVQGIAYMEAMVRPRLWSDMPEFRQAIFHKLRGPEGEQMVLDGNYFVETMLLDLGVIRRLSEAEKAVYRAPFPTRESRWPTLQWPREIVFDGEPADNFPIIQAYSDWLRTSDVPKLFVNVDEGHGTAGAARDYCRTFPNQREITVHGRHYVQEDAPHEIGKALRAFVQEVRGSG